MSPKTIKEDYDARQAVLLSLFGFLGLDMIRSVKNEPDLIALVISIARWFFPGFLSLVKSCIWISKQLRKEAIGTEARKKPFVKELIEDKGFIDTLFSPATVEKIKGLCGLQPSFYLIIFSRNPAPRPSKRFFRGKSSSSRHS